MTVTASTKGQGKRRSGRAPARGSATAASTSSTDDVGANGVATDSGSESIKAVSWDEEA